MREHASRTTALTADRDIGPTGGITFKNKTRQPSGPGGRRRR